MGRSSLEHPANYLISNLWNIMRVNYDGLNDFVDESLRLANSTSKNIERKIKKWDNKHPKHEYSGHDIYEKDFYSLVHFSNLATTSALILAHSELEISLKDICTSFGEEMKKKIRLKDIKGFGKIDQCKNYLEKVLELNFNLQTKEWEEIFLFNRLRNILVHQNGMISVAENQKIEKADDFVKLSKIANVRIDTSGKLTLVDEKPVKNFIKVSWSVVDNICTQLRRDLAS